MDSLSYKTQSLNKKTIQKEWIVVDATSATLGRLASRVAHIIKGKHKPSYTPNVDCGDNVIVINAEKIVLTGSKMNDKVMIRHTGYPGGQRFTTPRQVMEKSPSILIERAVRGMLPKSRLGRAFFNNLHVYNGDEHPHSAQQPKEVKLTY